MTGRTSFRDLLFVKDSQLRNWLPSIRGMIWVSCLKQFCDGWAFAESVICHFSSNHQWGINHYSLLVAKKIQYIAHFSILYRGWKHQIMLPKKRLLAESRQHCFWTKWPKMPTLNLQTVWKCNFCMIWAGRCPKEELVSRVCQNTNLFSSCHGVWAKWEDRKFGENTNWQTRVMMEELCSFSSAVWAISQRSYITLLHISFWMLVSYLRAVFWQEECSHRKSSDCDEPHEPPAALPCHYGQTNRRDGEQSCHVLL